MMFLKFINIIIIQLIILINCNAQESNSAENKDIKNISSVLNAQAEAWNRGDLEGYMQGYWKSESLIFIGKNGVKKGWNQTFSQYKQSYDSKEKMGTLTFSDLKFERIASKVYYVIGAWKLQRASDTPSGYFTLLFKKIDGQWVICSDHSS